jgi:hypothetical protein
MPMNVTFENSDGEKGLEARGRLSDAKDVRVNEPEKERSGKRVTLTLPPGTEWILSYIEMRWKEIEEED